MRLRCLIYHEGQERQMKNWQKLIIAVLAVGAFVVLALMIRSIKPPSAQLRVTGTAGARVGGWVETEKGRVNINAKIPTTINAAGDDINFRIGLVDGGTITVAVVIKEGQVSTASADGRGSGVEGSLGHRGFSGLYVKMSGTYRDVPAATRGMGGSR
jgi:hypothetical protein